MLNNIGTFLSKLIRKIDIDIRFNIIFILRTIDKPVEELTKNEDNQSSTEEGEQEKEQNEENKTDDSKLKHDLQKEDKEKIVWTQEKILENSRKFSLDLTPKVF